MKKTFIIYAFLFFIFFNFKFQSYTSCIYKEQNSHIINNKIKKDMNKYLVSVFLISFLAFASASNDNVTPDDVGQIFNGLVSEILQKEHDINHCISGKDVLADEFDKIVKSFKKGGLGGFTGGFAIMGTVIAQLPIAVSSCPDI